MTSILCLETASTNCSVALSIDGSVTAFKEDNGKRYSHNERLHGYIVDVMEEAGMNLSHAAHALGYGVQWLTEWYGYDARVKEAMGLDARDHVAGFFYIGTCDAIEPERDRPDLSEIVSRWSADTALAKGDCYDSDKHGFPEVGFALPD